MPFVTTWVYLEGIMLSEISMTEKYDNSFVYMWNLSKQNNRLIGTENRLVVARGGQWGELNKYG